MELHKIETLLEKYFDGQTSITDEKQLTNYFLSSDVAQHLEQYKPLFNYFSQAKQQKLEREIPLETKTRNLAWLSIAASVAVLLGVGSFLYFNNREAKLDQDLGTYDNPEIAFQETQKALQLLSQNVNVGIESVSYITEYENSKNLIFKK
jgi:uncharacterized protein HemX